MDELEKFKDDNTKEKVPNDELIISEIYGNKVSTNYGNLLTIWVFLSDWLSKNIKFYISKLFCFN